MVMMVMTNALHYNDYDEYDQDADDEYDHDGGDGYDHDGGDGYDHGDDDGYDHDDDDGYDHDDHDDYQYDDLPASAVTVRCERSETVKSAPSTAATR